MRILLIVVIFFQSSFFVSAQMPLEIQWQETIGADANDILVKISQLSSGGYIIGSYSHSGPVFDKTEPRLGNGDYWIVQIDSIGLIDWQNAYGSSEDEILYSIEPTSDGGYLLGGSSNAYYISGDKTEFGRGGTADYWLVKIDSAGNVLWDKTYGGTGSDILIRAFETEDGGYIIGGYSGSGATGDKTESNLSHDFWVFKIDSARNILWQRTLGGSSNDYLYDMIQTSDGGFLTCGQTNSDISGNKTTASKGLEDYWMVKLNNLGEVEWEKTIGGSKVDAPRNILEFNNGYVIAGHSDSNISGDKTENKKGTNDYWIVKTDLYGIIEWDKTIGGSSYDFQSCINTTVNGGLIVGGSSLSKLSEDKTEERIGTTYDYWIVELDTLGNLIWQNSFGGKQADYLTSISQTSDGGIILGGNSDSQISGEKTEAKIGYLDFWIIKHYPCDSLLTFYFDADGDSYGNSSLDTLLITCLDSIPPLYVLKNDDCNDSDSTVFPGAFELCDSVDNNCDGNIDEGFTPVTYYADLDGDGFGNNLDSIIADCDAPPGFVLFDGDCDDTDSTINPDAIEICDGINNNCDGNIDEGLGLGDECVSGEGACATIGTIICGPGGLPICSAEAGTPTTEICNGIDDDCDGNIDEDIEDTIIITITSDTTIDIGIGEIVTLYSDASEFCSDCYTYAEIPFEPEAIGGTDISMVDDTYIGPYDIGFTFCFFENTFTEFYISSNGWISFDEPEYSWSGNWTPDGEIPDSASNVPKNAIFASWTDWHTGLCTGCIHYETIGTEPNRRLVVTWDEVPLFSCTSDAGTFQIVLYETSNYIDNHFIDVMVCPEWDLGIATQGLQNEDGSIAYTVDGRNATSWEASEESWRWYTSSIAWYDDAGTLIGTGPTVDVSPEDTTVYTVIQTLCDSTILEDDVIINVFNDITYYADIDSDGFGNNLDSIIISCDAPVGYVLVGGDCDDSDAALNPDATEICDGLDNNCDGNIDEDIIETISISADGATTFCQGDNVVLTATHTGTSLQWKKNGVNIPGGTDTTLNVTSKGFYSCVTTSTCGTAISDTIQVIVKKNPSAVISAGGPTTFCAGDNVILSVVPVAGSTYQWYKGASVLAGATSTSYTAFTSGNYKCRVTKTATGCFKNSNVIPVSVICREGEFDMLSVSLFPNPTDGIVYIQFAENMSEEITISVYDITGKQVQYKTIENELETTIDLSAFASGIYLIEFMKSTGTFTEKIVKE